jgi:hypothetical protein
MERAIRAEAEIERLAALGKEMANEIDELGFPSKAETFLRALKDTKPWP